jgi:type I restriction enzyme S subunit
MKDGNRIFDKEQSASLPTGWAWAKIGEVTEIIDYRGRTPPFSEDGIPHLRSSNVRNGRIVWKDLRHISEETYDKYMTRGIPRKGDLLFTTEAPLGEVAPVPDRKFSVAQRMIILRPLGGILSEKFLLYQIMSGDFQRRLKGRETGTTVTGVSSRNYKNLEVVVLPISMQHRIVAKIEELFTKLDAGVKSLETVKVQLKQYQQSVLKSAFDGKLTEEWRRTHRGELEPASKLLGEIKKERRKNAAGKYKVPPPADTTDLPQGWAHGKLEDWIYIAGRIGWRGLKAEEYTQEGPLFLSVYDLNHGRVDLSHSNHISEERYNESPEIQLRNDDVLLVKDGAGIGKIGMVEGLNGKATVNSSLLVIRSSQVFEPRFLFYFLQGPRMQEVVKKRITGSATPHLFQRDIKKFDLFIPPLMEQDRIVEEIERCFSVASEVEETAINSLRQSEKLRQGILKRAFEGKLVSQDPNDEPASVLLERIKSLKTQMIQGQKAKKGRQDDPKQWRLL